MSDAPPPNRENDDAPGVRPDAAGIDRLLDVMARLRDPNGGCPWDLEQSFATIAPYTIEEAYEVAEAIRQDDRAALRDELGDLLLQVVFHAQMAREDGSFDFDQVARGIADKMIRRHPHVFGSDETAARMSTPGQKRAWEAQKAAERAAKAEAAGRRPSVLDDVALALPALLRAEKLQKRAARVGFDWPSAEPVFDKVLEEVTELREATVAADPAAVAEELGDSAVRLRQSRPASGGRARSRAPCRERQVHRAFPAGRGGAGGLRPERPGGRPRRAGPAVGRGEAGGAQAICARHGNDQSDAGRIERLRPPPRPFRSSFICLSRRPLAPVA